MALIEVEKLLHKLCLSEKVAISLDTTYDHYVLDMAAQSFTDAGSHYLAATSSNNAIQLFTTSNLSRVGCIKGHTDVITGISWAKTDPNLLFSSSLDKSIRCWDIRTNLEKEANIFEGSDETANLFTCVDVNATDCVLCSGMERDSDGNVYLLFWDIRGKQLLGCYSESHQDDITQVRFNPSNADRLTSGSTDGLVCLFDISQTQEDDALQYTFNSCSTVAKVGWCGEGWKNVFCTTHTDSFHVWDSVEGDLLYEITDLKGQLQATCAIDYLVDGFATQRSQIHVLAGTHSGDMHIMDLTSEKSPKIVSTLSGGHKATVRCVLYQSQSNTLLTGAEDSMICLWSDNKLSTTTPNTCCKMKLKAKKTVKKHKVDPY